MSTGRAHRPRRVAEALDHPVEADVRSVRSRSPLRPSRPSPRQPTWPIRPKLLARRSAVQYAESPKDASLSCTSCTGRQSMVLHQRAVATCAIVAVALSGAASHPGRERRMATNARDRDAAGQRRARASCRSSRRSTSGCTSRAWARTTRPRGADHRARRRLLRLGRARQALPRRPLRAVLRQRRPRPHRDRRGGGRRRSRSSASTRTGATRIRARSSWPRGSPALAPGDLNRVFFTSGGSEAVESALKLCRNYHRHARRRPAQQGDRARDRLPRHDARGARRPPASPALRAPFEPLTPGRLPRAEHQQLPLARGPRPAVGGRRRSSSGSCSRARRPSRR